MSIYPIKSRRQRITEELKRRLYVYFGDDLLILEGEMLPTREEDIEENIKFCWIYRQQENSKIVQDGLYEKTLELQIDFQEYVKDERFSELLGDYRIYTIQDAVETDEWIDFNNVDGKSLVDKYYMTVNTSFLDSESYQKTSVMYEFVYTEPHLGYRPSEDVTLVRITSEDNFGGTEVTE